MREEEYLHSLHFSVLDREEEDGLCANHSMPIVLPISEEDKRRVEDCSAFAITLVSRKNVFFSLVEL